MRTKRGIRPEEAIEKAAQTLENLADEFDALLSSWRTTAEAYGQSSRINASLRNSDNAMRFEAIGKTYDACANELERIISMRPKRKSRTPRD